MDKKDRLTIAIIIIMWFLYYVIIIKIGLNGEIANLQEQINELKFEQEYLEFVFEDNAKQ